MQFSLVVADGSHVGKVLPIAKFPYLMGRAPHCNLRPASEMVSKQHCALLAKAGKVYIHDFKSRNGTFVNDERITQPTELHDGDALRVGPLGFTVRLSSVAVNQATPLPPGRPEDIRLPDEDEIASLLLEMDAEEPVGEEENHPSTLIMEPPPPAQMALPSAPPPVSISRPAARPASNASTADAALKILSRMSRKDRK